MIVEAGAPFTQAAVKFAHRTAVRDSHNRSLTYAELRERANRVGSGLIAAGLASGDRVAVLSYNRAEVVELWLALERFGIVRVVLHSHFDMATHVATMNEVGAKALIFDSRFSQAVEAARGEMMIAATFVAIGDNLPRWAVSYEDIAARGSEVDPRLDVEEDAPCFLLLTSGTTGRPKPWVHSHRSWRAVIANNLEHLDTFAERAPAVGVADVNLHFHALQWATGFQTLMPYLLRGSTTLIEDDEVFDPAALAEVMLEDGVTGTFVPGPMLPSLLDALQARGVAAHKLRRMVIFLRRRSFWSERRSFLDRCGATGLARPNKVPRRRGCAPTMRKARQSTWKVSAAQRPCFLKSPSLTTRENVSRQAPSARSW